MIRSFQRSLTKTFSNLSMGTFMQPLGVWRSAKFTHFNLREGWLITLESICFVLNTYYITDYEKKNSKKPHYYSKSTLIMILYKLINETVKEQRKHKHTNSHIHTHIKRCNECIILLGRHLRSSDGAVALITSLTLLCCRLSQARLWELLRSGASLIQVWNLFTPGVKHKTSTWSLVWWTSNLSRNV